MKKIFTLAIFALCLVTAEKGQNIYGGDFEHWKYISQHGYYEPDVSMFKTLNILDTIPTPAGITVYPSDTAHTGTYSAGLVTGYIDLLQIVIPGVIGTIAIDWATSKAVLGIPYPYGVTKPVRFTGWYKSYPLLNDSSAAVVLLSKWNSGTHKRDTLAYTRMAFHGIVDTWTNFDTAVTYRDNVTAPDSLTLLYLSCAGFNASNMFGSVGRKGSKALFDDVNLPNVNGIKMIPEATATVKLTPNPASVTMKVEAARHVENGLFNVYDEQGRLAAKYPFNGTSVQISVVDLSAGNYLYQLTENNKLVNSGNFIVTK
jgi:hypothetical protein